MVDMRIFKKAVMIKRFIRKMLSCKHCGPLVREASARHPHALEEAVAEVKDRVCDDCRAGLLTVYRQLQRG